MDWIDHLSQFWPHIAAGFDFLAALLASIQVLLNKRDTRAAMLWLGTIWFLPLLGPILYLVLGVNRIRRRAVLLGVHKTFSRPIPENLDETRFDGVDHLKMIARVMTRVIKQPLTSGNKIQPLINGDEAFPAMLAAIDAAKKSISLTTYIFDNDKTGTQFADALGRAVKRGVEVRVLIDAAGTRYTWPPITHKLKRAKVPFAKFLPATLFKPWRVATINLRNHRKALIVDGRIAFTGGMNIRHGNVLGKRWGETNDEPNSKNQSAATVREDARPTRGAVQDLHFLVEGPLIEQLQVAFANDWAFTTREILDGDIWFPRLETHAQQTTGNVIARVIPDGPDRDFENLRMALLAALAEAQTSVKILTPYFLPDVALVSALNLAALRGVRVDILLPGTSNLSYVQWASRAMWWQVLERGCRIWLTPPPFDHSKLMIVDGHWVSFGSANWDARSLRLNFELNVECYGRDFAERMESVIEQKLRGAHEVTLAEVDARSLPTKLRDSIARLFSPYL